MHMAELVATLKGVVYSGRFALDTPAHIKKAKDALRKAFENQIDNKGFPLWKCSAAARPTGACRPLRA